MGTVIKKSMSFSLCVSTYLPHVSDMDTLMFLLQDLLLHSREALFPSGKRSGEWTGLVVLANCQSLRMMSGGQKPPNVFNFFKWRRGEPSSSSSSASLTTGLLDNASHEIELSNYGGGVSTKPWQREPVGASQRRELERTTDCWFGPLLREALQLLQRQGPLVYYCQMGCRASESCQMWDRCGWVED